MSVHQLQTETTNTHNANNPKLYPKSSIESKNRFNFKGKHIQEIIMKLLSHQMILNFFIFYERQIIELESPEPSNSHKILAPLIG